jgi:hypothetical protein
MFMEQLLTLLGSLPDRRRGAGKRHDQAIVLLLIILGTMNGSLGYRALGDFIAANAEYFLAVLPLKKQRLPSFSTLRRVIQQTDSHALAQSLCGFGQAEQPPSAVKHLSADGKALKGTVQACFSAGQDYLGVVSLFETMSKQVVAVKPYQNGKENEIPVLQAMIGQLVEQNWVLSADAIHCQKKRWHSS